MSRAFLSAMPPPARRVALLGAHAHRVRTGCLESDGLPDSRLFCRYSRPYWQGFNYLAGFTLLIIENEEKVLALTATSTFIFGINFLRGSQFFAAPHMRSGMNYLVPMLAGC